MTFQSSHPFIIKLIFSAVVTGFFFLSSACSNDHDQPGVVARVNESPIFLEEIESGYDMFFFEWSEPLPPSINDMKGTYGRVLMDVILVKLIEQELKSRNLSITQDEILKVENEVREDYPDDEFDKMLIEEYIDLGYWRSQVKHKLLWEKFVKRVLMPSINVKLEEINEYYYSNINDFYIPERMSFLYLASGDNDHLKQAAKEVLNLDAFNNIDKIRQDFENLVIVSYEMPVEHLPDNLSETLLSMSPGDVSDISEKENGQYFCLYVTGYSEEELLKPHQAYSLIEKDLTEEKLGKAFDQWLRQVFIDSKIEVNTILLEKIN
ncbi:MAG: peptidylprolyl isomerase [Desulfovibrionales bacterium]|nr:peptidylprolyl isomerase [Desulfovibrionales bacterium]